MLTSPVALIREMERAAVASGTAEYELMLRAGVQAGRWIAAKYPLAQRFVILCGGGNNGGDALVAARYLFDSAKKLIVYSTRSKQDFSGCAAMAAADLPEEIPFLVKDELGENDFFPGDVIVDGILGIGFSGGKLRENAASFIRAANSSSLPVVALDLPSGIDADSGDAAENGAIKADLTLTFGRVKPGLFQSAGSVLRGTLRLIDIGLSGGNSGGMEIFTNLDAVEKVPRFPVDCHKNSRGRVLIWGGSPEYPGAAALSTLAALKSGAGLVRCASSADLHGRVCNAAIVGKLASNEIPEEFIALSDVLVCGCGWGKSVFPQAVERALDFPGCVVLDADALNFIAGTPEVWKRRDNIVITPHPGEAARLCAAWKIAFSGGRVEQAAALAEYSGAVTVLKGHDTVVAAPGKAPVIIAGGNALLATAGSGDVLAGTIGALAAQGVPAFDAASLGAYIHGIAAEDAGEILIADELPALIARKILQLQRNELV